MASKGNKVAKAAKSVPFNAADLASIKKANTYIQRLIEDAELRENVREAIDSSRSAYNRLTNGKPPHRALLEDKKLQHDLRHAFEAARDATTAFAEAPKRRKRKGLTFGRMVLISLVGATLALALSEPLRSKVLDKLFGAEEEFQYTPPPTTPAPAAPTTPVSAA